MKKISVLAVACLCLLAQSCDKKKNISADPPFTINNSIDKVYEDLSVRPKTLTIDASTTTSFYGNSGTRYTIYAHSLAYPDGTPVTGQVQVVVTEWLERGDMIFSKMLPVSNGQPLVSGGEIDIKITQNGQSLHLKGNSQFRADVPQGGAADPDMELFWGGTADSGSGVNWTRAQLDSIELRYLKMQAADTISIYSDSLLPCNIDKYLITLPNWHKVNVNIVVQGASYKGETWLHVYQLYDNLNVVTSGGKYETTSFPALLPDMPVSLAAFTLIGGKFYGGTLSATPATGKNYTITLNATDPAAYKKLLNSLK